VTDWPRIVKTTETCWGAPRIAGTRLTTRNLARLVEGGDTIEEVAEEYGVEPLAVFAAVCFERGVRLSRRAARPREDDGE
jgi:uncharacterized protein (DUF433 family)